MTSTVMVGSPVGQSDLVGVVPGTAAAETSAAAAAAGTGRRTPDEGALGAVARPGQPVAVGVRHLVDGVDDVAVARAPAQDPGQLLGQVLGGDVGLMG